MGQQEVTAQSAQVGEAKVRREVPGHSGYHVHDSEEEKDIHHEDWEMMRRVTTDKERKILSKEAFRNSVLADPGNNLAFHGYRCKDSYYTQDGPYRRYHRPNLPVGSFAINMGAVEPLPGYKRKNRECHVDERERKKRRIGYGDFGQFMKSLYYKKYERKMTGENLSQKLFEQFQDYMVHVKSGQEETENFLAFYCNKVGIYFSFSVNNHLVSRL